MICVKGQVVAIREGVANLRLPNGDVVSIFTTHPLTFGEVISVIYDTDTHTILYTIPEGGSIVDDSSYNEVEEPIYDETFYED